MEKTNTEYINQIAYDMIYLASFGINSKGKPDEKCLERYRTNEENIKELFRMSAKHFIDALVGTTLKRAGVVLPKYWEERMVKAVRKVILFDAERKKLCAWMDREHIWYLPLKGIVLKEYYPSVGMRQMSDNDILFDADAWERVEKHMISEGYEAEAVGKGNHDVYQKPPVYNFELHRSLYGKGHDESWVEYYSDIKNRLLSDKPEGSCGYHMSDEDFYIYIISHAYKHYSGRQNFFALIGQQKLSEVRKKYQIVLPRVLLIVDEFQQLFLEATPREATQITDLLTSITKLGRATGFHLMFASNNDFNDFYMCHKACDYLFVTGNNESYYNKLRLPFTHKSENSIAVDFAISSSATQRSFKKFKYELQEVVVPEIDFDAILN